MPMVTLVKTLDITRLVRYSRRQHTSLNMLLCWCIGKATNGIAEFFVIPEQGKFYRYDALAISVIVQNVNAASCPRVLTFAVSPYNMLGACPPLTWTSTYFLYGLITIHLYIMCIH